MRQCGRRMSVFLEGISYSQLSFPVLEGVSNSRCRAFKVLYIHEVIKQGTDRIRLAFVQPQRSRRLSGRSFRKYLELRSKREWKWALRWLPWGWKNRHFKGAHWQALETGWKWWIRSGWWSSGWRQGFFAPVYLNTWLTSLSFILLSKYNSKPTLNCIHFRSLKQWLTVSSAWIAFSLISNYLNSNCLLRGLFLHEAPLHLCKRVMNPFFLSIANTPYLTYVFPRTLFCTSNLTSLSLHCLIYK